MDKPTAATATSNPSEHVIGIDLGDRYSHVCVLDRARGEVVEAFRFKTTREGLKGAFAARSSATVALEVSGHSRWVSVELAGMGTRCRRREPRRAEDHRRQPTQERYERR